jgi:hypothetical protein
LVIVPLVAEVVRLRDMVTLEREALARERGVLEETPRLEALVSRLEEAVDQWKGRLLPAASIEASATLSDHLNRSARVSGILLQRIDGRSIDGGDYGVLRFHSASVRAVGDLEGVLRFLHRLENDDLLVRVEQIQLATSPLRAADRSEPQSLALTAVVSGFSFSQGEALPRAADEGAEAIGGGTS